jgi:hypothetical protein
MGAHVSVNFEPMFGFTIESRMKETIVSIAFIQPEGTGFSFFIYFWIGIITKMETSAATTHNMSTCFVTDISMPKIGGR